MKERRSARGVQKLLLDASGKPRSAHRLGNQTALGIWRLPVWDPHHVEHLSAWICNEVNDPRKVASKGFKLGGRVRPKGGVAAFRCENEVDRDTFCAFPRSASLLSDCVLVRDDPDGVVESLEHQERI